MIARRTRRISSSLFPLNMTPAMTSIHPPAWWNGPLGPLALEKVQGRGGELGRVELSEQRLQSNHFARCNALGKDRPKLLSHCLVTIAGAPLGSMKIERRQPPT